MGKKTLDPETLGGTVKTNDPSGDGAAAVAAAGGNDPNADPSVDMAALEAQKKESDDKVAAAKEAKALKVGQKAFIYNPQERTLRDPYTGDKFPFGTTVKVKELGQWTIVQVSEGILREGKEDDVGVETEDNSDFKSDEAKAAKAGGKK